MASWAEFEAAAPALAAAGHRLLHSQSFDGRPIAAGFLATVRKDGGPRVHPVYPRLVHGRLWLLIVEMSHKFRDLQRDPRIALHAYPTGAGGEEFYVDGIAVRRDDGATRDSVGHPAPFERLFEADIHHALYTKWENWGTARTMPTYRKWPAA